MQDCIEYQCRSTIKMEIMNKYNCERCTGLKTEGYYIEEDEYIPQHLLDLIQNYIPPDYVTVEISCNIKSLNNKELNIGDIVFYKKENIELIIKSIEKSSNGFLVTMQDGTEFETDKNLIIEVYKNE